jgi:very-short-patch-repair endonuclease
VLDFYCAKARLAIEIDGMSHDVGDRPELDLRRDAWLEAHGVKVMRIPAGRVRKKLRRDRRRNCANGGVAYR